MTERGFLAERMPRPWTPHGGHGFRPAGLFVGKGANAIEVAVAEASRPPTRSALLNSWKDRRAGRAAPLLLIVLYPGGASMCGASGEEPPVYPSADPVQLELLSDELLEQPNRHAALRYLAQVLPSLETALPGLNNEGLAALHELKHGAPNRHDWAKAREKASMAQGKRDDDLLASLGFRITKLDNLTKLLRSGERRTALAVLLRETEWPEAAVARFNSLSPVSYALAKADAENLRWVVVVQGNRLRLYSTAHDAGVGRRGRTETFIECQPSLLSEKNLPYLWLLFSAEALSPEGSLSQILDNSERFAGDLAERLRERIYDDVVPVLAQGIAKARNIKEPDPDELDLTYEMALTVLFRMLFIAYAEDRDLLPYRFNDAYKRRSLKQKAQELAECIANDIPIAKGSSHWHEVASLSQAVAAGNREWAVPAYNGGLFASDAEVSRVGAELAKIIVPNVTFEAALRALLVIDTAEGVPGPVDFRALGVRQFGTIYEGLLESELALADADLVLKKMKGKSVYIPAKEGENPTVLSGEIYLHNRSGARKSSGSYYTKHFAVEHLLDCALEPALADHFARLDKLDDTDAAEAFFDFRIADIAMGSGHFLVAALDRVEKGMADFLANRDLPGVRKELAALREVAVRELGELAANHDIEDFQLLRRLIARRCIYGVDLNELSVQLARLAIWIHTFVPGLPLSLLDHTLVRGNSLVGVGTVEDIRKKFERATGTLFAVDAESLLGEAAKPLNRLANISDATLEDIAAARDAMRDAREAIGATEALCDLIAAGPMSSHEKVVDFPFEDWERLVDDLETFSAVASARRDLVGLNALHFPVAFPEVFLRSRKGFDVIIGNPPWEKLRVEHHEFWARYFPGLRGIKSTAKRDAQIRRLEGERPDLVRLEGLERAESEALRNAVRELPGMNTGHPDLFRAFMGRFTQLLAAEGGRYGVVLPGDAFKIKGNRWVRRELDARAKSVDLQMLTNRSQWIFEDVDGRKLVALVTVELGAQKSEGCTYHLRPEHHRLEQFANCDGSNVVEWSSLSLRRYSSGLVQPTLPTSSAVHSSNVLATFLAAPKLYAHPRLKVRRVYADVETSRKYKRYYDVDETESDLWPVYGGDSFDIWEPDTGTYYAKSRGEEIFQVVQRKRTHPRKGTPFFDTSEEWRRDPDSHPCLYPRIAYRDVTNRTNTRTLIASLIPPKRVLTQSAPWVLWLNEDHATEQEAFLLGVMSCLPADWWMRRFVEGHVDQEAFDELPVPDIECSEGIGRTVARLAGRLASPDDRFSRWAASVGVECGSLAVDEKEDMICELDAVVSHLYRLSEAQLVHIFETFHEGWDYQNRLDSVLRHYHAWSRRG